MPMYSDTDDAETVGVDLDQIGWYLRCLDDVDHGRPVRCLDEAKLGADLAWNRLQVRFAPREAER